MQHKDSDEEPKWWPTVSKVWNDENIIKIEKIDRVVAANILFKAQMDVASFILENEFALFTDEGNALVHKLKETMGIELLRAFELWDEYTEKRKYDTPKLDALMNKKKRLEREMMITEMQIRKRDLIDSIENLIQFEKEMDKPQSFSTVGKKYPKWKKQKFEVNPNPPQDLVDLTGESDDSVPDSFDLTQTTLEHPQELTEPFESPLNSSKQECSFEDFISCGYLSLSPQAYECHPCHLFGPQEHLFEQQGKNDPLIFYSLEPIEFEAC